MNITLPVRKFILSAVFFLVLANMHAQLRILPIIPSDSDPNINTYTSGRKIHVTYYDSSAVKRNQLYVFLPGTNGSGFGAPMVNKLAAQLGYHVIALQYPDSTSISTYNRSDNPNVYSQAREEIITGENVSKEFDVNKSNSIINRLTKVLLYLAKENPGENWLQFLNKNGEVIWKKIVLAGQSQGGGHAAFIAKKHKVARVLMFASPKDYSVYFKAPVDWISWDSETPVNRYFTFVHTLDNRNGCTFEQQIEIWKQMQMFKKSQLVNVDSTAVPYQHSRVLTSTKKQDFPHGAVISDAAYMEVWRYMLTERRD